MNYGGNAGNQGYGSLRGDGYQSERKGSSQMSPKERFDYAKSYRLNLPKGGGRELNEIANDDDGLLYLDWLMGQEWLSGTTRTALTNFLEWPAVAQDVERIKERRLRQATNCVQPRQEQYPKDNGEAPW